MEKLTTLCFNTLYKEVLINGNYIILDKFSKYFLRKFNEMVMRHYIDCDIMRNLLCKWPSADFALSVKYFHSFLVLVSEENPPTTISRVDCLFHDLICWPDPCDQFACPFGFV